VCVRVYVCAYVRVRSFFDCCDATGMGVRGVCTCVFACGPALAVCVSVVLTLRLDLCFRGANREDRVCAMTSVKDRERFGLVRIGESLFFVCVSSLMLCVLCVCVCECL